MLQNAYEAARRVVAEKNDTLTPCRRRPSRIRGGLRKTSRKPTKDFARSDGAALNGASRRTAGQPPPRDSFDCGVATRSATFFPGRQGPATAQRALARPMSPWAMPMQPSPVLLRSARNESRRHRTSSRPAAAAVRCRFCVSGGWRWINGFRAGYRPRVAGVCVAPGAQGFFSRRVRLYAVVVDAKDDQAAGFYRKLGFRPTLDDLLCLYLPLTVLRQTRA